MSGLPAPQACDLHGAQGSQGPEPGLMLCRHGLEFVITSERGPGFHVHWSLQTR